MAQKVVQYQAALQLAQGAPQLYNLPELHRQMLEVLGIPNYQKLVPMEDDMKPRDPITENQNVLKGKPVKAFLYQDHQAHIAVHTAAMQDPKIQAVLQQSLTANPQAAQTMQAAMSAHINEHLGFEYRKQIEQSMGMEIPKYGEDDSDNQITIPEEMEVQISQMAAQASQQLLQQHQQEAEQQQNQQQQQDPLVQMQQQELQIKAQDLQRKIAKDQSDAQLEAMKIQVEREKIGSQQEAAGATMMAKMQLERHRIDSQQEADGAKLAARIQETQAQINGKKDELSAKLGVDVAMKESDREHQRKQNVASQQHELYKDETSQSHAKFLAERQAALQERLAAQQQQPQIKEPK
jgi:hypothetical protein